MFSDFGVVSNGFQSIFPLGVWFVSWWDVLLGTYGLNAEQPLDRNHGVH